MWLLYRTLLAASLWCCLLLLWFQSSLLHAQTNNAPQKSTTTNNNLVQLSGIVIDAETSQPILYAAVNNRRTRRGELCDENGYFSLVVQKGDSVRFSAVGYVTAILVVPTDLQKDSYSVIKKMKRDNIVLPEATIYPYPKPYEFKDAFMSLQVPDDDLKRAKKNLERETLRERGETLAMDGRENYSYQARQYSRQMYSYGQMQYQGIFDPMAWAKFFKSLRRGEIFEPQKKQFELDENYIIDENGIKQ